MAMPGASESAVNGSASTAVLSGLSDNDNSAIMAADVCVLPSVKEPSTLADTIEASDPVGSTQSSVHISVDNMNAQPDIVKTCNPQYVPSQPTCVQTVNGKTFGSKITVSAKLPGYAAPTVSSQIRAIRLADQMNQQPYCYRYRNQKDPLHPESREDVCESRPQGVCSQKKVTNKHLLNQDAKPTFNKQKLCSAVKPLQDSSNQLKIARKSEGHTTVHKHALPSAAVPLKDSSVVRLAKSENITPKSHAIQVKTDDTFSKKLGSSTISCDDKKSVLLQKGAKKELSDQGKAKLTSSKPNMSKNQAVENKQNTASGKAVPHKPEMLKQEHGLHKHMSLKERFIPNKQDLSGNKPNVAKHELTKERTTSNKQEVLKDRVGAASKRELCNEKISSNKPDISREKIQVIKPDLPKPMDAANERTVKSKHELPKERVAARKRNLSQERSSIAVTNKTNRRAHSEERTRAANREWTSPNKRDLSKERMGATKRDASKERKDSGKADKKPFVTSKRSSSEERSAMRKEELPRTRNHSGKDSSSKDRSDGQLVEPLPVRRTPVHSSRGQNIGIKSFEEQSIRSMAKLPTERTPMAEKECGTSSSGMQSISPVGQSVEAKSDSDIVKFRSADRTQDKSATVGSAPVSCTPASQELSTLSTTPSKLKSDEGFCALEHPFVSDVGNLLMTQDELCCVNVYHHEDERFRQAVEDEQQRWRDEVRQAEIIHKMSKIDPGSEGLTELERVKKAQQDEEERQDRRKRLEAVMRRIKSDDASNVPSSAVEDAPAVSRPSDDTKTQFQSPLLQHMMQNRSRSVNSASVANSSVPFADISSPISGGDVTDTGHRTEDVSGPSAVSGDIVTSSASVTDVVQAHSATGTVPELCTGDVNTGVLITLDSPEGIRLAGGTVSTGDVGIFPLASHESGSLIHFDSYTPQLPREVRSGDNAIPSPGNELGDLESPQKLVPPDGNEDMLLDHGAEMAVPVLPSENKMQIANAVTMPDDQFSVVIPSACSEGVVPYGDDVSIILSVVPGNSMLSITCESTENASINTEFLTSATPTEISLTDVSSELDATVAVTDGSSRQSLPVDVVRVSAEHYSDDLLSLIDDNVSA